MKIPRRLLLLSALAAALPAAAQDWPSRPLRLMVGSSAGGGTDAMARAVADKLGPALKTSVVVE
ncbi:ABC transporter substrate-binding protein, partial [Rubrivivax gelatinosus]|nr:ABC transporter substrate-binding protein [Rubrivivax gelatinosus]